jgi:type I restriction enzyme S subunit
VEKYDFVGFENIEGDIAMKDLPTTWKEFSIEDLMEAIIDYRGKTPAKTTSGIPLITAKIIDNGKIHTPTEFISQETYVEWMKRGFPKKGDVLITTEAPLGEVAQLYDDKVALAQRVILLRGRSDKLSNSYLKWVLQSSQTQKQLYSRSTGSTVLGIKQSELRKVKIPLPPLNEQKRIAAILDKADAIRRKRKQAIALTEDLLRSAFLEMFGDPVTNPKGWEVISVSKIIQGDMRNGLSPSNNGKFKGSVLTLSAITQGKFDINSRKFGHFDIEPPSDKKVYSSLFLVCRGNGNINLVGCGRFPSQDYQDILFPDTMIAVPLDFSRIEKSFLEYLWNSQFVRRQIEKQARTTNGTHKINQKSLSGISILLPPIELQKKFTDICSRIQSLRDSYPMNKLNDLFNSLLQRAFRGEL